VTIPARPCSLVKVIVAHDVELETEDSLYLLTEAGERIGLAEG
jgi:hypothetical protein